MTRKYMFYPGCSMQSTAKAYLDSLDALQEKLDIELVELDDWNCCGATEYHSVHSLAAHALIGRNLAVAQEMSNGSRTLTAACSACYLNLSKTDHYMNQDENLASLVNNSLSAGGMQYDPGSVEVRHLLDVIYNDIGIQKLAELVEKPLKGLRVAAYYGCMLTRPDYNNQWDSTEYPNVLEEIMTTLGATAVDFPMKTHCCGGHMTQISPETAYELIWKLVDKADRHGADILVTVCPMCQLNLDVYQVEMNKFYGTDYQMPILFFTQLIGVALGLAPEVLGIGKEFVGASEALAKIDEPDTQPERPKAKKRKKKKEGLPMPHMAGINGDSDG